MVDLDFSQRTVLGAGVRATWFSITNLLIEHAGTRVLFDGYVSRLPKEMFHGGPSGYAFTNQRVMPDLARVSEVVAALCPDGLDAIVTGHSHFDHSFDVAAWHHLTGAKVIGSRSTCLQAIGQGVPVEACTVVEGGETIELSPNLRCDVIRWNHSGHARGRMDLHTPLELRFPPDGRLGLRPGVFEDFPNGGGSRGYLFTATGDGQTTSLLATNTGAAEVLDLPVVCEDRDFGAPVDNLQAAMTSAGLDRIDVWAGMANPALIAAGAAISKPRFFIPMHWEGIFHSFEGGVPQPFDRPEVDDACRTLDITRVTIAEYFDAWDFSGGDLITTHNGTSVFTPQGNSPRSTS